MSRTDAEVTVLTPKETRRLMTGPRPSHKYSETIRVLTTGQGVFVPAMTRAELETLRQMVSRVDGRILHSRSLILDGQPGRLLVLGPLE